MKAVQLIGYGDAVENLEVRDVPEPPQPSPGEVLVGVEYAPINFNDLMVPWGVFPLRPNPPATIGNEGAGVVLALGEGVRSVAVGDRVVLPPLLASVPTYQQRLNVPASDVVVVPPDTDPQQASMMGINPVSAELLLTEYVALKAGDAVVFNSATSGLSHWLITLAKERGIKSIGFVRKVSDVVTVTDRGCDFVIVDDEPLDEVAKKLEGLNIPLGLDVLGGPSAGRVAQILTPGGKLVVYGGVTLKPMELSSLAIIGKRLTVEAYFQSYPDLYVKTNEALNKLVKHLGPKGPTQPVAAVYPLDRVKDAVAHAVTGTKVLLHFDGAAGR
ncbi:zinc-dependent alcohol dehydrogenase family protein [Rhizobium lusitanum]|uniref:zinc-dependent alcohol dehydrogenase family protein n=1 Tax=Rhizobium lusitanum TaxID=293958 RepID=UPI00195C6A55|nr:zinc-dependent alcohol dehydrogenase family protein [Rhizobium lusitanum]MBM7049257.1 zinc-dependent alcohol dehydrogenase family protein [Rhizobium lusitanum]